jgi:hypothetical protein
MEPTDSGEARLSIGAPGHAPDTAPARADAEDDHPFGPHAAAILATEHWSLLGARSLIWSEALNRVTVFLTLLSASIVALALLANATDFGPQTTTLALVLLPVVLLLGIATYFRLVRINAEEYKLVMAMNRLRHAYLKIEPALKPYLTTGYYDDEKGVMATYMVGRPSRREWWLYFMVNTPTLVATVVAALASAMAVLGLQVLESSTLVVVAGGVVVFFAGWGSLLLLQQHLMDPGRGMTPKFPTPADTPDEG